MLRAKGTVLHSEFCKVQDATAREIDAGVKPRVLAILANFEGWELKAV